MAVVGDVFASISASVADDAYVDIQPASGHEARIHNIYWADDVTVEFYDGTNSVVFDSPTGAGCYGYFVFEVTNTYRIRVRNVSGSTQNIGYSGTYTSVP